MTDLQRNAEKAQRMIDALRLIGVKPAVTLERIVAVLDLVDGLNTQTGSHLSASSHWIGLTDAEIEAEFGAQIKRGKKRAGVKALVKKYGHETAERILEKRTGRHIGIR